MNAYYQMIEELIKHCEKALETDKITATLFTELLNRFEILLRQHKQLEKKHLEAYNKITDFGLFRYELTELMEKGKAFLDKK